MSRTARTLAIGIVIIGVAACGGGGGDDASLVFDSGVDTTAAATTTVAGSTASTAPGGVPQTATPTTATPTTAAPQLGPWVDATANLAGMASECGNTSFLSADPGRDRLIAGIALNGLWANDAGTDQWVQLGTGPGSAAITNRTATIVFDPDNPDRFWESGHYGGPGAFVTTDGGVTFQALDDVAHLDVMSVDLADPERKTMLVGAHESGDLLRSTDGGATWTNVGTNLPSGAGVPHQTLAIDGQTHLVGTTNSESAGIFRTTDGGATWAQVHAGGVGGIPLVAADGSIYWLLEARRGLIRSTDGGATWTQLASDGIFNSTRIVELPDGRLVSAGDQNLVVSNDQGLSWQPLGPAFPTEGGVTGVTYSAPRNAVYTYRWDCGDVVPAGSIRRLDLTPAS